MYVHTSTSKHWELLLVKCQTWEGNDTWVFIQGNAKTYVARKSQRYALCQILGHDFQSLRVPGSMLVAGTEI